MKLAAELSVDPLPIMRLATGYWESQCFLTANRVGVFRALADGPLSAEAVAERLDLSSRHTDLLLRACVGIGLLEEHAGTFCNHPASQLFLVPGTERFLGNAVSYGDDMWHAWGKLGDCLRNGEPSVSPESYTGDDTERTRHFVYGMHERAKGIGAALSSLVDLSGRRTLLDVGGGPGTYSALLTRRFEGLRSTVMDLPDVVAIADEIIESVGAADRVKTLAADYARDPWPTGYDVVLISGVFHRENETTCRELIRRARASLVEGGLLIVSDVFTDHGGAAPVFAALFGLNMMLSAPEGGVHADSDVSNWMEQAGFRRTRKSRFPSPMPHRLVMAERARDAGPSIASVT